MTVTKTPVQGFEDLYAQIKAAGPTFDNIEFSVTSTWDEKHGSYRYCRMVRFVRGSDSYTVWVHTFKAQLTHIIVTAAGEDHYIEAKDMIWGYPSEWGIRQMIGEWIAEFSG